METLLYTFLTSFFFAPREAQAKEGKASEPRNKNMYEGYKFDQRRSSIDSYKDNSSS